MFNQQIDYAIQCILHCQEQMPWRRTQGDQHDSIMRFPVPPPEKKSLALSMFKLITQFQGDQKMSNDSI